MLRDNGFNVRWYILGGGEAKYKRAIEKQLARLGVADMMVFLGTVSNPYRYIADCDIYAQPSRTEARPIAVDEAKILCKPIIATSYLSAPEQLGGGSLGYVCVDHPMSIYHGIEAMLTDKDYCPFICQNLSARDFSNHAEIEKFYKMLE